MTKQFSVATILVLCSLGSLLCLVVLAQTRISEPQMPGGVGTSVRALVAGISRQVPLDPSLEITGTPLVMRVAPGVLTSVRSKTVSLPYTGGPVTLPETPLATGFVLVVCGGMMQRVTEDYTLVGATLTPSVAAVPAWTQQGIVSVSYFF